MKCIECSRDDLTERELEIHTKYFHKQNLGKQGQQQRSGTCLDCGGDLWHENGCVTCHSCGFSKCG